MIASLIDLAIGFAREQKSLEAVVLGICDVLQFEQLMDAWTRQTVWYNNKWKQWSLDHVQLLDPRCWPK